MKQRTYTRFWVWISLLVIVADHISKLWAVQSLDETMFRPIFSFLSFILSYNYGAAFSFLGQSDGWQRWLFITLSTSVSIWLIYLLFRGSLDNWIACAIALTLGGAIGNLYDRIRLGYVIDFIDFHIGYWHFPTFNLADAAISIGAMLWLIASSIGKR